MTSTKVKLIACFLLLSDRAPICPARTSVHRRLWVLPVKAVVPCLTRFGRTSIGKEGLVILGNKFAQNNKLHSPNRSGRMEFEKAGKPTGLQTFWLDCKTPTEVSLRPQCLRLDQDTRARATL